MSLGQLDDVDFFLFSTLLDCGSHARTYDIRLMIYSMTGGQSLISHIYGTSCLSLFTLRRDSSPAYRVCVLYFLLIDPDSPMSFCSICYPYRYCCGCKRCCCCCHRLLLSLFAYVICIRLLPIFYLQSMYKLWSVVGTLEAIELWLHKNFKDPRPRRTMRSEHKPKIQVLHKVGSCSQLEAKRLTSAVQLPFYSINVHTITRKSNIRRRGV